MREPFARVGDHIDVGLGGEGRRLAAMALRVLDEIDLSDGSDPGASRLTYSAHPGDESAERRFRELTSGMLADARRKDRATVSGTLESGRLTVDEAEAWARVIGEARLVLGARLGIEDGSWEEAGGPGRDRPDLLLLQVLGAIQDALVRALLDAG